MFTGCKDNFPNTRYNSAMIAATTIEKVNSLTRNHNPTSSITLREEENRKRINKNDERAKAHGDVSKYTWYESIRKKNIRNS